MSGINWIVVGTMTGAQSRKIHTEPEWRDEVFAKIRENPQHQFLFLTKRPDLLNFDTDLENAWFGVTVTRKAELWRIDALRKNVRAKHYHVTFEPLFDDPGTVDFSGINWIVVGTMTGAQSRKIHTELEWAWSLTDPICLVCSFLNINVINQLRNFICCFLITVLF